MILFGRIFVRNSTMQLHVAKRTEELLDVALLLGNVPLPGEAVVRQN
jgi:hypothetical protein